jgi:hypothetical protein
MDTAVALVQAYLHVNGYFTVAEYPVLGEVKEGAARLNAAMRDPVVLEVALARFGCCPGQHAAILTRQLLARGHATTPGGHSIRMVAFGDIPDGARQGPWTTVPMRHVVLFLRDYLREHWAVLRHAQIRDPALGVLALIEKWGVEAEGVPTPNKRQKERTDGGVRVQRRS